MTDASACHPVTIPNIVHVGQVTIPNIVHVGQNSSIS